MYVGRGLVYVLRKDMQLCVIFLCVCMFVCIGGARTQVQLWLRSLNRSQDLGGSAFKGSVSPWVEVIR